MSRAQRMKPALWISAGAVAAIALGTVAGGTMALWHDEESFASQIGTGKVAFAVGSPTTPTGPLVTPPAKAATASGQKLTFDIGKAEATVLLRDKEIAIPIQVDSLSQGNKGLRYQVAPPVFESNSLFSTANTRLVKVDRAADCTTDPRPTLPSPVPADYYTSTPVSADYSDGSTPTREFWCLTATLNGMPGAGSYTNKVKVTADSSAGQVSDNDQWWANVTSTANASKEPTTQIGFTFKTFRPGA